MFYLLTDIDKFWQLPLMIDYSRSNGVYVAVMTLEQLMDISTAEPVILAMDCDAIQLKNISEINYWLNIGRERKKVKIIFDPLNQFRNIGVKMNSFLLRGESSSTDAESINCCSESVTSLSLLQNIDSIPDEQMRGILTNLKNTSI
jgi:hypothetical protein